MFLLLLCKDLFSKSCKENLQDCFFFCFFSIPLISRFTHTHKHTHTKSLNQTGIDVCSECKCALLTVCMYDGALLPHGLLYSFQNECAVLIRTNQQCPLELHVTTATVTVRAPGIIHFAVVQAV